MSEYSLLRTPWIELTQLSTDDEGWWHLTTVVADVTYAVQQEFYVYPSALLDWAGQLATFPSRANDEVRFHIGDRGSAHWVWLRAWLVDRAGHAAIAIDLGSCGDELYRRTQHLKMRDSQNGLLHLLNGLLRMHHRAIGRLSGMSWTVGEPQSVPD